MTAPPESVTPHSVGIHVRGGLHDGAVVALARGVARSVGSGADMDILLVDEALQACQCTLRWSDDDEVELTMAAPGLQAYGRALHAGTQLFLAIGAVVSVATVSLSVVRLHHTPGEAGRHRVQEPSAAEQLHARRALLRQLHWALYAVELLRANRNAWVTTAGLIFGGLTVASAFYLVDTGPGPEAQRSAVIAQMQALFPAVQVKSVPGTDVTLYEGYVQDQRELGQLRSMALAVDAGRTIVRVVPMDVIMFNAATWLDAFYESAAVEAVGPGKIKVTVASGLAVKQLEGWDFSATAARLQRVLPELTAVDIAVAAPVQYETTLPAAQLGMSFVPLVQGGVYVVGADGSALFPGAITQQGRITDVSVCDLSLQSRETGSIFRLSASLDHCSDQHIPPGGSAPKVKWNRGTTPP